MKRLVLVGLLFFMTATMSGCAQLKDWVTSNQETIYTKVSDTAVSKLNDLIDNQVAKLVADGKITEKYAEELRVKCKSAVKEAFKQLDMLVAKKESTVDAE